MPLRQPGDFISEAVFKASEFRAAQQERLAERVARSWLPRPLRWLVDHPRLLKAAYAVGPRRWRPTISVGVDGDVAVYSARMKDGTMVVLQVSTPIKVVAQEPYTEPMDD